MVLRSLKNKWLHRRIKAGIAQYVTARMDRPPPAQIAMILQVEGGQASMHDIPA